jgi:hypothetical protein
MSEVNKDIYLQIGKMQLEAVTSEIDKLKLENAYLKRYIEYLQRKLARANITYRGNI